MEPTDLITAYFDAWRARDAEALRTILADDVTFVGPLGGCDGIEANVEALRGFLQIVTGVEIHRMVADGNDVMTAYDLHTSVAAPTRTVNWSTVENGRLRHVRAFFDPRAFGA